jgi:catechol 2,3-dioxygenase-like lactoylglutathione lyase family enzyme
MDIIELTLKTHRLTDLRSFYAGVLGMALLDDQPDRISLRAGTSRLTFEQAAGQSYQYHFAFNIPAHQIEAALDWLKGRATLQPGPDGDIVIGGPNWKSKALYFADPAGNIAEFIARERLPDRGAEPFSAASLLNISEIGLAFDDVQAAAKEISPIVPPFYEGSDTFQPLGDDRGLLILVNNGRGWFPTGEVKAVPLYTNLKIAGSGANQTWQANGYPYTIRT